MLHAHLTITKGIGILKATTSQIFAGCRYSLMTTRETRAMLSVRGKQRKDSPIQGVYFNSSPLKQSEELLLFSDYQRKVPAMVPAL